MDDKTTRFALGFVAGAVIGGVVAANAFGSAPTPEPPEDSATRRVVQEFLDAQSKRDLEKMCNLVDEEIIYINEPHPPERTIRGKAMFREAFAASPCIWCEKANLQVLQTSHVPGSDTVFVERLDQFFIEGKWLKIPICGYLRVKNGKIAYWKDYYCYAKYKAFVTENYGPDFRLFRKTVQGSTPSNSTGRS